MGRQAHVIDRGEHRDLTATRWLQPADELHRPLRVGGSIEADDDTAHISLSTTHDEDGALGASSDPSRDAPHQKAAHGTVTAPAEHDHVGGDSLRLMQYARNRRGVDNGHIGPRPAAREGPARAAGDDLGTTIEGRQQNRFSVVRWNLSRGDAVRSCSCGPRKPNGGRDCRLCRRGPVCGNQNTKVPVSTHAPSHLCPPKYVCRSSYFTLLEEGITVKTTRHLASQSTVRPLPRSPVDPSRADRRDTGVTVHTSRACWNNRRSLSWLPGARRRITRADPSASSAAPRRRPAGARNPRA